MKHPVQEPTVINTSYLIFSKKIGEQWLWTLKGPKHQNPILWLFENHGYEPQSPVTLTTTGGLFLFWYTLSPKPPNIGIYVLHSWGALNNVDNSFENRKVLGLRVGAHWKLNRRQQLCMSTVANCLWRVVHLWSLDVQSFNYFIEQSSETQMPCMGCCQALSGYVSLPLPT